MIETANDRIAILGAGPAGLATAHFLRKAGHRDVTVLEREPRVGGKCCTFEHEGRSYEMGAAVISPLYTKVRALLDELGLPTSATFSGHFVDVETRSRNYLIPEPMQRRWLDLGTESTRYLATVLRARHLWRPGFADVPEEHCRSFDSWARDEGFTEVRELVRPWFTGFGYGYLDEIPAAYVLKYMTVCGFPLAQLHEGGFRALWERVARPIDVRTSVTVRRITRDGRGVTVETDAGAARFDRLVLACPFDRALDFLDASPEERALFEQIRTIDYRVFALKAKGLGDAKFTFSPKALHAGQVGEPMFWYRRWEDSDLLTFYAISDRHTPMEETRARVEATVAKLGGKVEAVVRQQQWDYFPHVHGRAMAAGYYRRFEEMQGERRTYYAGELLCFPTVETVTAYSMDLVKRHFGRYLGAHDRDTDQAAE